MWRDSDWFHSQILNVILESPDLVLAIAENACITYVDVHTLRCHGGSWLKHCTALAADLLWLKLFPIKTIMFRESQLHNDAVKKKKLSFVIVKSKNKDVGRKWSVCFLSNTSLIALKQHWLWSAKKDKKEKPTLFHFTAELKLRSAEKMRCFRLLE